MEFGETLRKMRRNAGLTQQQMADVLYTSRSDISKIEHNKMGIRAEYLLKWCKITNNPETLMALYYATEAINLFEPAQQLITGTILLLGGLL